jgi:opacity protein-like surface antigen
LWVDLPIGEVIRPYVGGGLGFGRLSLGIETTNISGGTMYSLVDDSDWGFAYQLGAVSWRIRRSMWVIDTR